MHTTINSDLTCDEMKQIKASNAILLNALRECVSVMEIDLHGLSVIQPELKAAKAAIFMATREDDQAAADRVSFARHLTR